MSKIPHIYTIKFEAENLVEPQGPAEFYIRFIKLDCGNLLACLDDLLPHIGLNGIADDYKDYIEELCSPDLPGIDKPFVVADDGIFISEDIVEWLAMKKDTRPCTTLLPAGTTDYLWQQATDVVHGMNEVIMWLRTPHITPSVRLRLDWLARAILSQGPSMFEAPDESDGLTVLAPKERQLLLNLLLTEAGIQACEFGAKEEDRLKLIAHEAGVRRY